MKVKGREEERKTELNMVKEVKSERKQLGWKSLKMAENAARDHTKWQKLQSGIMHQLGCEISKLISSKNIKKHIEQGRMFYLRWITFGENNPDSSKCRYCKLVTSNILGFID